MIIKIKAKVIVLLFTLFPIKTNVFAQCPCNYVDVLSKYENVNENNEELLSQLQTSVNLILYKNHCKLHIKVKLTNEIANLAAVNEQDGGLYIYINPKYYRCARDSLSEFEMLAPICHEIGHHMLGHCDDSTGSLPFKELDADYYSGYLMYGIGAKDYEAIRAIRYLGSDFDRATHPNKRVRITAILAGYNRAKYD